MFRKRIEREAPKPEPRQRRLCPMPKTARRSWNALLGPSYPSKFHSGIACSISKETPDPSKAVLTGWPGSRHERGPREHQGQPLRATRRWNKEVPHGGLPATCVRSRTDAALLGTTAILQCGTTLQTPRNIKQQDQSSPRGGLSRAGNLLASENAGRKREPTLIISIPNR